MNVFTVKHYTTTHNNEATTMITPTKRATRRLAASLAMAIALAAAQSAWAAGFWKGTGQDSATTGNWTNSRVFMNGDYFYVRDSKMTGTDYRRYMRLTADVTNTNGDRKSVV